MTGGLHFWSAVPLSLLIVTLLFYPSEKRRVLVCNMNQAPV